MSQGKLIRIEEIATNESTKPFIDFLIADCKFVQSIYKSSLPNLVRVNNAWIEFQDEKCVILVIEDKKNPVKFSYNSITDHFHIYREILQ